MTDATAVAGSHGARVVATQSFDRLAGTGVTPGQSGRPRSTSAIAVRRQTSATRLVGRASDAGDSKSCEQPPRPVGHHHQVFVLLQATRALVDVRPHRVDFRTGKSVKAAERLQHLGLLSTWKCPDLGGRGTSARGSVGQLACPLSPRPDPRDASDRPSWTRRS
jgi:hypothetical protein